MKQTATVDLEVFNRALMQLQMLSGEVSHLKVNPIVQSFAGCFIPSEEEDKCLSDTPPKSSSKKSETEP